MGALLHDLLQLALGGSWDFSWGVWSGATVLLALATVVLTTAARPVLDPVVLLVALHPVRCFRWMAIAIAGSLLGFALLVFTVIGAPLAVIGVFAGILGAGVGYIAIGTVIGDRLLRLAGYELPAIAAGLLGLGVLRLIRLIPGGLGALSTSLLLWFAYAAACALAWDLAVSWHRRRMPDNEQFAGETIIEWNPPGPDELA